MTGSRTSTKFPTRLFILVLLHVLAAPVYVARFAFRSIRTIIRFRAIRHGAIECPHCHSENALDLLATCRRCGATEFGSRLHCSNCGQANSGFACDACGALIRVL
jgi:RecJ-like exonuclease